jgi:CRP-like cAMP-binding protein
MHGFNWIESLAGDERKAMMQRLHVRVVPASNTLFRQGDPVTEVYQISGEVRQCILTEDGQEALMYIYRPGDVIGDSSCEDLEPYPVTVLSQGETVVRYWKLAAQRAMYTRLPCQCIYSMRSSHSPFLSAPEVLSRHLLSL